MTIDTPTRKRPTLGFARWVILAIATHALIAFVIHRTSEHAVRASAAPVTESEIVIDDTPPASMADEPSSPSTAGASAPVARSTVNERADPQRAIAIAENHSALEAAAPGETGWSAPVQKATGASTLPLALGLGAHVPAGQTNINLSTGDLPSLMSEEERKRIIATEETHRLEVHRERFAGMGIGQWRSAIEGYVPAVKLTNQRPMGPAQKPFVAYLKTMQSRIHPILADDFVEWLRSLPAEHPLRRPHLSTRIEIAIDAMTGAISKMGVVLASGVTAFDVGVLDAIKRAAPFGPAPDGIASDNGAVYVQWDFKNEPYNACTVDNARPSVLKTLP